MKLKYYSSVKVSAGWREVSFTVEAEQVSPRMAIVKNVLLIDGEAPHYGQSRTGANRQQFDGRYWAKTQIGAKKRLSACTILDEVPA